MDTSVHAHAPARWRALVAIAAVLALVATFVPPMSAAAADQPTCDGSGYEKPDALDNLEGGDGDFDAPWGYLDWDGNTLEYTIDEGWTISLCVKGGGGEGDDGNQGLNFEDDIVGHSEGSLQPPVPGKSEEPANISHIGYIIEESPPTVEIELEKFWFNAEGELITEDTPQDVLTLESHATGETISEGDTISVPENSTYSVNEDGSEEWDVIECPYPSNDRMPADTAEVQELPWDRQGTGNFELGGDDVHHVVCNQFKPEVSIELEKFWFDADGDPITEDTPQDVLTLESHATGETISEGDTISVPENSTYSVNEDGSEEWDVIECPYPSNDRMPADTAEVQELPWDRQGTGNFELGSDNVRHVVCNQLEEDDDEPTTTVTTTDEVDIDVSKVVEGDAPEDGVYEVTVTCDEHEGETAPRLFLRDGAEPQTVTVDAGQSCTVTEVGAGGADQVSIDVDGDTTAGATAAFDLPDEDGATVEVEITNTFIEEDEEVLGAAPVTIAKDIDGDGDEPEDTSYGFDLSCETEDQSFDLAAGEETSFDITVGQTCTLDEVDTGDADEVAFVIDGAEGQVDGDAIEFVIPETDDAEVAITVTNTFDETEVEEDEVTKKEEDDEITTPTRVDAGGGGTTNGIAAQLLAALAGLAALLGLGARRFTNRGDVTS